MNNYIEYIFLITLTLLVVVGCSIRPLAAQSATYELTPSMNPEPHLKVRLILDGYGGKVKWMLPRSFGKWNNLYKNIQNLKCSDTHGNELPMTHDVEYIIEMESPDKIICSYMVVSNYAAFTHSTRHQPLFRKKYFYFFGEHFVISSMGVSRDSDKITALVILPNGWRDFSTWNIIDKYKKEIKWSDLKNATFAMGDYRQISTTFNRMKLRVVLRDEWPLATGSIAKQVQDVVSRINDLWGDRISDEYFVFINQYDKDSSSGWYDGTMRRDAIALEVADDISFSDTFAGLIAHEYIHSWNGGIMEPDCKDEIECSWFQEGVASYLADIIASNRSSNGPYMFSKYLKSRIATYLASDVEKTTSFNLGDCFWKDSACYNLVYDRGYLLSWMIDYELRKRSGGVMSLFGYTRYLLNMAGEGIYLYDNKKLLSSINAYSGTDFLPFWKKYVLGHKTLPVNKYLNYCGMDARNSNKTTEFTRHEANAPGETSLYSGTKRAETEYNYKVVSDAERVNVTISDLLNLVN